MLLVFPLFLLASDPPGYRFLELKPDKTLDINMEEGKYKALFLWETEGDDDPSVQITYISQEVKYQRNPILATSALVYGDSASFQVKRPVNLHFWLLPAELCPDLTFVYSTSISLAEQFTFGQDVPNVCFFFDNPSSVSTVDVEILSRKTTLGDSRVRIYNSLLEDHECPNGHCESQISDRFFVRFSSMKMKTAVRIEVHFQGHDTQNICGREAVPVYNKNETLIARLAVKNPDLICDDSFKIEIKKKKNYIYIGIVAVVAIAAVVVLMCRTGHREPMPQQIPKSENFDIPRRFLEEEKFSQVP
jgi:hypothetical protein